MVEYSARETLPSQFLAPPLQHSSQPCLRDPLAIIAFRIGWIQEMTEAVLGPPVFFVIHLN